MGLYFGPRNALRTPSEMRLGVELSLSFWYTQAIYVAAKLGVADRLKDGPRTIAEFAAATGAHAPSLYRVMRALASTGVFEKTFLERWSVTTDLPPAR